MPLQLKHDSWICHYTIKLNPLRSIFLCLKDASGFVRVWCQSDGRFTIQHAWPEPKWDWVNSENDTSENNQTLCCAASPDGNRLITAGSDGRIRVYETANWRAINFCDSTYALV